MNNIVFLAFGLSNENLKQYTFTLCENKDI